MAVQQRFNAASVLAGGASSPPTASANCRTTRCSTSGAISPGAMRRRRRWCSTWAARASELLVCEDAWFDEPAASASAAGAQVLRAQRLALPRDRQAGAEREERMAVARTQHRFAAALLRTSPAGRTRSCSTAPRCGRCTGACCARADVRGGAEPGRDRRRRAARAARQVEAPRRAGRAALVTGVRDYLGKNGFPGAIIGLSGGIDWRWCWRSRSMRWAPTRCAR